MTKLTNCCRLQFKYMRFYTHACLRILKIGIPAGISSSMFAIANLTVQKYMNSYGDVAVTGNTAAHSISGFETTLLYGFAVAAVNFIGQNYGAQNYERVIKIKRICMLYTVCLAVVLATLLISCDDFLLGIYIKDSPEALEIGKTKLFLCAAFIGFNTLFEVLAATMRGIGQPFLPTIVSIICACGLRLLYIYTIYQLPEFNNLLGLFYCYPISWIASFFVGLPICKIVEKKRFAYHTKHMEAFSKDTFRDPNTKD